MSMNKPSDIDFCLSSECHACDNPIQAEQCLPALFDENGRQLCSDCFHRHFDKMAALESQDGSSACGSTTGNAPCSDRPRRSNAARSFTIIEEDDFSQPEGKGQPDNGTSGGDHDDDDDDADADADADSAVFVSSDLELPSLSPPLSSSSLSFSSSSRRSSLTPASPLPSVTPFHDRPASPTSPNTRFNRSLIVDFYRFDGPPRNTGTETAGGSHNNDAANNNNNNNDGQHQPGTDDHKTEIFTSPLSPCFSEKVEADSALVAAAAEAGNKPNEPASTADAAAPAPTRPRASAFPAKLLSAPCHFCLANGDLFCPECNFRMCPVHSKLHEQLWRSSRASGSHLVVVASEQDTVLCEEHSRVQDLFCNDCQAMVCCLCMFASHKAHEAQPALQVVPKQRELLKQKVEAARASAKEREQDMVVIADAESELKRSQAKTIERIDAHFSQLSEALRARRAELIKQVGEHFACQQQYLNDERTSVVCAVAQIQSSCEKSNRLIVSNNALFVKGRNFALSALENSTALPRVAIPQRLLADLPVHFPSSLQDSIAAHGTVGLSIRIQGDQVSWEPMPECDANEGVKYELGVVDTDKDLSLTEFVRQYRLVYEGPEKQHKVFCYAPYVARVRACINGAWTQWSTPVVGSRSFRAFEQDDELDALDPCGHWYRSKVIEVHRFVGKIKVHYINWDERYDEWIASDSPRLAPAGTHTTGPYEPALASLPQ